MGIVYRAEDTKLKRVEKPVADVFAVQSEVADKVAASLAVKLLSEMVRLKRDPSIDPLRSEPRFQDLLRRMNFPQ